MSNNTGNNKALRKRWEGDTSDFMIQLPTYPAINLTHEEYSDPKKKEKAIRREKAKNALKLLKKNKKGIRVKQ